MKNKQDKKDFITFLIVVILIILLRTFIVTPIRVNGTSMDDTLKDGEIMLLNKINYRFNNIKRFDIVVVEIPNDHLIKRVIGLPGESLKFEDGKLYINNKLVKEDYLTQKTDDFNISELGYDKIPQNCYFVMGDNRSASLDSRYFGCFQKEDIMGSTKIVIFPFTKAGKKNN